MSGHLHNRPHLRRARGCGDLSGAASTGRFLKPVPEAFGDDCTHLPVASALGAGVEKAAARTRAGEGRSGVASGRRRWCRRARCSQTGPRLRRDPSAVCGRRATAAADHGLSSGPHGRTDAVRAGLGRGLPVALAVPLHRPLTDPGLLGDRGGLLQLPDQEVDPALQGPARLPGGPFPVRAIQGVIDVPHGCFPFLRHGLRPRTARGGPAAPPRSYERSARAACVLHSFSPTANGQPLDAYKATWTVFLKRVPHEPGEPFTLVPHSGSGCLVCAERRQVRMGRG